MLHIKSYCSIKFRLGSNRTCRGNNRQLIRKARYEHYMIRSFMSFDRSIGAASWNRNQLIATVLTLQYLRKVSITHRIAYIASTSMLA